MANMLGDDYCVIEDGINGRSTVWDDPTNLCLNEISGSGIVALEDSKILTLHALRRDTDEPGVIRLSDSYIMMTLWICEEGQYKTLAAKFEL